MSKVPSFIRCDVPLAPLTTFKIGGPAKYLAEPTTDEQVMTTLTWARSAQIPWRILGRGANTLVSDQGFPGLVLVMKNDQLVWHGNEVTAGAGVQNGQLIASALQHRCGGMQWLIGVPGTVGGSLYGNAGGHGWGLGDQVIWVEAINPSGKVIRLDQQQCEFSYRTSWLKAHPEWCILRAQLTFPTVDPAAERDLLAATTKQKNANQPTTAKTAGCMFTNPTALGAKLTPELQAAVSRDGTISAWRLIETVGLKGYKLGQVQISDRHANFMINLGGGTADQVLQLISLVKQRVRDTMNIQLHEEVQYVGFEQP